MTSTHEFLELHQAQLPVPQQRASPPGAKSEAFGGHTFCSLLYLRCIPSRCWHPQRSSSCLSFHAIEAMHRCEDWIGRRQKLQDCTHLVSMRNCDWEIRLQAASAGGRLQGSRTSPPPANPPPLGCTLQSSKRAGVVSKFSSMQTIKERVIGRRESPPPSPSVNHHIGFPKPKHSRNGLLWALKLFITVYTVESCRVTRSYLLEGFIEHWHRPAIQLSALDTCQRYPDPYVDQRRLGPCQPMRSLTPIIQQTSRH
jgi:hypothetical protein